MKLGSLFDGIGGWQLAAVKVGITPVWSSEIDEMQSYKPWRKAMKSIEQHIGRKGEMLPNCPHCKRGFRLEEVSSGVFTHQECCENKGWSK